MRPQWRWPLDEDEPSKYPKLTWVDKLLIVLTIGAIIGAICMGGCVAMGQPYITTNVISVARISGPAPPIPALPIVERTVARMTNDVGEKVTVITEKPVAPPITSLKIRKSWTNAFWIMCTECDTEAIRKPTRIETVGAKSVEDGEEREYAIYFRCCGQEIKSRYVRRVTTPIAVPVQIPEK